MGEKFQVVAHEFKVRLVRAGEVELGQLTDPLGTGVASTLGPTSWRRAAGKGKGQRSHRLLLIGSWKWLRPSNHTSSPRLSVSDGYTTRTRSDIFLFFFCSPHLACNSPHIVSLRFVPFHRRPSRSDAHRRPGTMLFKSTLSALWLATLAWGKKPVEAEEENVKSIDVRCFPAVARGGR